MVNGLQGTHANKVTTIKKCKLTRYDYKIVHLFTSFLQVARVTNKMNKEVVVTHFTTSKDYNDMLNGFVFIYSAATL